MLVANTFSRYVLFIKLSGKLKKAHMVFFFFSFKIYQSRITIIYSDTGKNYFCNSWIYPANTFINSFNADICFISVTNLSRDGQLTDNSIAENLVRRIMLTRSKKKALMLDSTKIGGPCISNLCNLDIFDYVICDTDLRDLFPNYRGKFI